MTDTIAAISTAPGPGGIGIIRISGPGAFPIGKEIFRRRKAADRWEPTSHRLYLGNICDPENGQDIDEVLAVFMKAPATYTREDVVEIHAHGGPVVLREILALVMRRGARLAEGGEFTRRAFLSGRLDLSRAEAVTDIILAKTAKGLQIAEAQLSGGLAKQVERIRDVISGMVAELEAAIDFPDDVPAPMNGAVLARALESLAAAPIRRLLKDYRDGQLFREGVKTVVVGKPNVGKSSLLNALLQRDRAIVTEYPGTTRDLLEESLNIDGIPFVIADSAGLHHTENPVEILGIRKTWDSIQISDMILFLVDAEGGVLAEDRAIFERIREKEPVLVINKIDKVESEQEMQLPADMKGFETVRISAKAGKGLDSLKACMTRHVLHGRPVASVATCVPNLRQKQCLEEALAFTENAVAAARQADMEALISMDLREACDRLAQVTGNNTSEDVLDLIFSRFCIGK